MSREEFAAMNILFANCRNMYYTEGNCKKCESYTSDGDVSYCRLADEFLGNYLEWVIGIPDYEDVRNKVWKDIIGGAKNADEL